MHAWITEMSQLRGGHRSGYNMAAVSRNSNNTRKPELNTKLVKLQSSNFVVDTIRSIVKL